jgi:hypothetical protein
MAPQREGTPNVKSRDIVWASLLLSGGICRRHQARSLLICLAAFLGVILSVPFASLANSVEAPLGSANAAPVPNCLDSPQPKLTENPKISIVLDPKTAWQPRGGTVNFTISGNNVSLEGVKVIVCFGWPIKHWNETKFLWEGRVSLTKFDTKDTRIDNRYDFDGFRGLIV